MSYEEKGTWVYLLVAVVTFGVYSVIIVGRVGDTPVSEVSYVSTMLWALGIGALAGAVVRGMVARPGERRKGDERDRGVTRVGEHIGGIVLAVAMVVPFGLAMAEFEYFWIVNAMYAAYVLQAVVSSVVKLVAYRRGF